MRITERRLRTIIRQVIRESRINEMMDFHNPYDSMAGAAGHAQSISNMLREKFRSVDQIKRAIEKVIDPTEAGQMGSMAAGMITALQSGNENILDTQFLLGLGICVGTALWILINNYVESGNIMQRGYKNEAERQRLLRKVEEACPQCVEEAESIEIHRMS